MSHLTRTLLLLILTAPVLAQQATSTLQDDLRRHVAKLASEECGGRFGEGAEVARAYIEKEFAACKLERLGESWRHPFARSGQKGVNLAGVHRGEVEPDRHVIVSAHYDHLGRRGERWFPGACDNASGVAAMLAIAKRLEGVKTRRTIVFVAFDLEEQGLLGSFAWTEKPPLPLEQLDFFITMDMLGRRALGIVDDVVFALGWEWTPEILPLLHRASAGVEGVATRYFWTDVAGDRSDFVAFKEARKPHLFFSTGENPDYHKITDTPERVDHGLLSAQTRVIERVVRAIADDEKLPACRERPERHVVEFESMRDVARALMKSEEPAAAAYKSQAAGLVMMAGQVVERGEVTREDRENLLRVMRQLQAPR